MINVCICDDDILLGIELQNYIYDYAKNKGIDLAVHNYSDSYDLQNLIEHKCEFDIFFLDILMPEVTGMDLARTIRKNNQQAYIIFLTSSPEFALESYEVEAANYLMKPINVDNINDAIDKIMSKRKVEKESCIVIKQGGVVKSLYLASICYLESFRNKVIFHINTGEEVTYYQPLSLVEDHLKVHSEFIKVHRSYIINMNYIHEIKAKDVELSCNYTVPVSKSLLQALKDSYFTYMGEKITRA